MMEDKVFMTLMAIPHPKTFKIPRATLPWYA